MNLCKASIYSQTHSKVDIGVLQASHKAVLNGPDGLFAIMVKQGSTETVWTKWVFNRTTVIQNKQLPQMLHPDSRLIGRRIH